jgi:hypothetical protein
LSQLAPEQIEALTAAIRARDYLQRIVSQIEELHRIVFHANQRVDWQLADRSAEQILIAEIIFRYQGRIEGLDSALRGLADSGKTWDSAVGQVSAAMHSYFTTPLGIVMRQDLFGDDAVFITPDAHEWTAQVWGRTSGGQTETS